MVRTFRAPDARTALAAVKEAFGPDAVIVSSREVVGTLLSKPQVEIVAALQPDAMPAGDVEPLPHEAHARALKREVESLRIALASARRELAAGSWAGRALSLPPAAQELFDRLSVRGVEEAIAEEVIRQSLADGVPAVEPALTNDVWSKLADRVAPGRAPWLPSGRRVIALVGPTGVGKTTTVAKIAARAKVEQGLKVALITVDTFRIAGAEQLGRYGQILGVPVRVARDRGEILSEVMRATDADLVLIDSAGRATDEEVLRQADLLRQVPDVELHLALSAATGARELAASAEKYLRLRPERVIFTKVDEAAAPGGVLSAAVRVGRPVSCFTNGQSVPEDIHPASPELMRRLVLGE